MSLYSRAWSLHLNNDTNYCRTCSSLWQVNTVWIWHKLLYYASIMHWHYSDEIRKKTIAEWIVYQHSSVFQHFLHFFHYVRLAVNGQEDWIQFWPRWQSFFDGLGQFHIGTILAASTHGKKKSSFTIVYSHWCESACITRVSNRGHSQWKRLAHASEMAKKWTFNWNLIGNQLLFYLFCPTFVDFRWKI